MLTYFEIMRTPAKNTDCVKRKTAREKLTISIKKKSDNSIRIITGESLDQILRELMLHRENNFSLVRNSSSYSKGPEKLVLNKSFSNNVSAVKIGSNSANLPKNKCNTIKIPLEQSFSENKRHSNLLKQSVIAKKSNNAFKHAQHTITITKREKTECALQTNLKTCQNQVGKEISKYNQTTRGNKFSGNVEGKCDNISNVAEDSDSRICVIEEVFGNAVGTFSNNDDITFYDDLDVLCLDPKQPQLIKPKKTDDITKIKGWRRKQFFVEKPTLVGFKNFPYESGICSKKGIEQSLSESNNISSNSHAENAFVCESLDEFLEQDAKLKINYEIPHLFAEFGIKLTKEEIASAPTISEKDIQEVETKYCRSVPTQTDINFDETTPNKIKRKRQNTGDGDDDDNEDDDDDGNGNGNDDSFKIVKLENNSIRLVRTVKKSTSKETDSCSKYSTTVKHELKEKAVNAMKINFEKVDKTANDNRIKLITKKLGLVVYPSPHRPLHPIVQFHLKKLRSYHTVIDSNWANFAASAVIQNDSKYQRCILPAECCVKILNDSLNFTEKSTNVTPTVADADTTKMVLLPVEEAKIIEKPKEDHCTQQSSTENFSVKELKRMKNCKVIMKKLKIGPGKKSWCADHNRFSCKNCNVKNFAPILQRTPTKKIEEFLLNKRKECEKPGLKSSQPGFYEDVVNLLAKKLKQFNPDSLTSIDSLKTLSVNAIELIKLKFIQKSFWHDYISIWYQKPEEPEMRARAFLTFSKTQPVPNAINLRCGLDVNYLPKVIREIMYADKSVDPNEYVLLYCNGDYWEIYGSVNVAFNKSIKSTEQVTIPPELPEVKRLQDLSFKTLRAKAFKWWILDLTQEFRNIELKWENIVARISHKKLYEFIKRYTSGFMPLRTNPGGRIFGAYMIENLLPYVLIGPYYFFEIRNINLKGDSSSFSFAYSEVKDSNDSNLLKFHINSSIKEAKNNGMKVEGLWLHYRTCEDDSCFLEVMTTYSVNTVPRSNYSIQEEHGYSLNCTSDPDLYRKNADNVKVEVYLYFDIFGLGYVIGVLEEDNSVTINHPLNERTKVNSAEIGNWFLGILRRRLKFIPQNLVVNWFITKNKSHLKNRPPFNKNFLNGAHVLTDSGVFYLLQLSDPDNQDKVPSKANALEAASKSKVIEEVIYLKKLSDILVTNPVIKPTMDKVLTAAVKEITTLQNRLNLLERVKACLEEEKLGLLCSFLMTIHLKGLNKEISILLLKQIEKLLFSENGTINETYAKKLKVYNFGRQYLRNLKRRKLTVMT